MISNHVRIVIALTHIWCRSQMIRWNVETKPQMELIIPKAFPYLVNHLQTNYKYLFVTCRETVYSFIWLSFFSSPFVQPACADLRVRPACLCAVHDQRKLFMAFIYIVFVVFCVCVCASILFYLRFLLFLWILSKAPQKKHPTYLIIKLMSC